MIIVKCFYKKHPIRVTIPVSGAGNTDSSSGSVMISIWSWLRSLNQEITA